MSTMLPVADGKQVLGYVRSLFRRHPRAMATMLTLHLLAAVAGLAGPRLLGELVQAVDTGTTTGHVDKVILVAGRVPGAADAAHPAGTVPLLQPGRAGAGRAARGLRRQLARAPGRRGRERRLRRPAHPHLARRRAARLVGALGAARVGDRADHHGGDARRGGPGRLVGAAAVRARRAAAGDRAALVPRACQGRLPRARARRTRSSTPRSPRRSRARARWRRSGSGRSASPGSTATSPTPSRRSATRSACAPGSSRPSRSPT